MQAWGQRLNNGLAIGLAAGLLGWLVLVLDTERVWVVFLVLGAMWVYLLSLVLLVEWAASRLLGRGPPALPGPLGRFSGRRFVWVSLVAVVVLVTGLREGMVAPSFVLNFDWNTSSRTSEWTVDSSFQHQEINGAPAVRLAGRHVSCSVTCGQAGAVCRAFLGEFSCDSDDPADAPDDAVFVQVSMDHGGEPFCYTPLYKGGDLSVQVQVDAQVTDPRLSGDADISIDQSATADHSIAVALEITQTLTGFGSCYGFRSLMGTQAAVDLAQQLKTYLKEQ